MDANKEFLDDASDDRVSSLLRELPRISAPANMEQAVLRRIRNGVKKERVIAPWLKLLVPTAALGAIALFFAFERVSYTHIPDITVVEEQTQSSDRSAVSDITNAPSIERSVAQSGNTKSNAAVTSVSTENKTATPEERPQPVDQAIGPGSPDLLPKGHDLNGSGKDVPPGDVMRPSVKALDVLQFAGVRIRSVNGESVVTDVVSSSPAERAGVQSGDIIVQLNSIRVTSDATLPGGTDLRTLTVMREGRSMVLRF